MNISGAREEPTLDVSCYCQSGNRNSSDWSNYQFYEVKIVVCFYDLEITPSSPDRRNEWNAVATYSSVMSN